MWNRLGGWSGPAAAPSAVPAAATRPPCAEPTTPLRGVTGGVPPRAISPAPGFLSPMSAGRFRGRPLSISIGGPVQVPVPACHARPARFVGRRLSMPTGLPPSCPLAPGGAEPGHRGADNAPGPRQGTGVPAHQRRKAWLPAPVASARRGPSSRALARLGRREPVDLLVAQRRYPVGAVHPSVGRVVLHPFGRDTDDHVAQGTPRNQPRLVDQGALEARGLQAVKSTHDARGSLWPEVARWHHPGLYPVAPQPAPDQSGRDRGPQSAHQNRRVQPPHQALMVPTALFRAGERCVP